MAPKSELILAGTTKFKKQHVPKNPMTTKEKITATEAKKANNAMAKPVSLPPPGEAFQPEPRGLKKAAWKKNKPMTTREKVKANGLLANAETGEPGGLRAKGRLVSKKEKSTFDMVMDQASSSHEHARKIRKVTERPTYKTKRMQEEVARLAKKSGTDEKQSGEAAEAGEPFKLMKLPQELRAEIWKLVVVETKFFVWPALPSGREQPDLAMVNRQIRAEVLPVFYRFNIFAIEVAPTDYAGMETSALEAMMKWCKMLGQGGWFISIRSWAFHYDPQDPRRSMLRDASACVCVFVQFSHHENEAIKQGAWNASLEVHREARCVLRGTAEYGRCILGRTPEWLNKRVIDIADSAGGRDLHRHDIVQLARSISDMAHTLSDASCLQTEHDQWLADGTTAEANL